MRTVFDVSDPDTNAYALLTSVVVPRPIAWITSIGSDGVGNLAPHSFFNVARAHAPRSSASPRSVARTRCAMSCRRSTS